MENQVVSGPVFFRKTLKEVKFDNQNVEIFAEGLKRLGKDKAICFTNTQFTKTFGKGPKFMKHFRYKMYKAGLKPSIQNEGNKLFIYKGKVNQN
jgi:hypothetical protein